jgi:hypothetical protein
MPPGDRRILAAVDVNERVWFETRSHNVVTGVTDGCPLVARSIPLGPDELALFRASERAKTSPTLAGRAYPPQ